MSREEGAMGRAKRGFTLIEVIVVIAVIAVLAGILIPVIAGVIERSRVSKGVGEFKNFKTAIGKLNAEVGYFPPEIGINTDPGLAANKCPAYLEKKWKGPYMEIWPKRTAWESVWDYDYATTAVPGAASFNFDGKPGNEVVMFNKAATLVTATGVPFAMPEASANAIDEILDQDIAAGLGQVQYAVDVNYNASWLGVYMGEGYKW